MENIIPQDDTPLKRCPSCPDPEENQWHPATTEYFHRDKASKDGLAGRCKACVQAYHKTYYSRPEIQERGKAYRRRPEVRERQKVSSKAYHSSQKGRERYNAWQRAYYKRPEVRARETARLKTYRRGSETRERFLAYQREYQRNRRSRPETRGQYLVREKAYGQRQDRKIYRREYQRTYQRAYNRRPKAQERNKAYRRRPEVRAQQHVHAHNRRAHKRAIGGTYTTTQIQEQLKRQHYRCYYAACGYAKFEKRNGKYIYHIDHTFPLSRVADTDIPANSISYLVLACPSCNLSKGNKFPWEWVSGGRLL